MSEHFAEPLVEPFGHGHSWQEIASGSQPAAGAGFAYPILGQYISRVVALTFRLVTDANVAARQVAVQFEDGNGSIVAVAAASGTQAASLTKRYSFHNGAQGVGAADGGATRFVAGLPDVFLTPGMVLRVVVDNVQAADQLSQIFLVIDQAETHGRTRPRHRRHSPRPELVEETDRGEDFEESTGTSRPNYYR